MPHTPFQPTHPPSGGGHTHICNVHPMRSFAPSASCPHPAARHLPSCLVSRWKMTNGISPPCHLSSRSPCDKGGKIFDYQNWFRWSVCTLTLSRVQCESFGHFCYFQTWQEKSKKKISGRYLKSSRVIAFLVLCHFPPQNATDTFTRRLNKALGDHLSAPLTPTCNNRLHGLPTEAARRQASSVFDVRVLFFQAHTLMPDLNIAASRQTRTHTIRFIFISAGKGDPRRVSAQLLPTQSTLMGRMNRHSGFSTPCFFSFWHT